MDLDSVINDNAAEAIDSVDTQDPGAPIGRFNRRTWQYNNKRLDEAVNPKKDHRLTITAEDVSGAVLVSYSVPVELFENVEGIVSIPTTGWGMIVNISPQSGGDSRVGNLNCRESCRRLQPQW